MTSFLTQMTINIKRLILRNLGFSFFAVGMPIGFYLLFTRVMVGQMNAQVAQHWYLVYLGSMSIYSILISSIFTVSNTLIDDHKQRMDQFIAVTPFSKKRYYSSIILTMILLNALALLALDIVAMLVNQVPLSLGQIAASIAMTSIASLPIMILGILTSMVKTTSTASALANLIVFPMAIVSGLWLPLSSLPKFMQTIGKLLPTYHANQMITRIFQNKSNVGMPNIYNILAWSVLLVVVIIFLTNSRKRSQV
ncbi:ABC transporter permease [Agrilactobacillus fermenti]|uniref:ABC transporter permease n=1 Tax=Agrilactobacillus fermenti TaxID=2586909 RepID=UPI003A5C001F